MEHTKKEIEEAYKLLHKDRLEFEKILNKYTKATKDERKQLKHVLNIFENKDWIEKMLGIKLICGIPNNGGIHEIYRRRS